MSESALLRAVRDRIRAHADFTDNQVDIEIDELAPSTAPDLYVMVIPGGLEAGPTNDTSGGVIDLLYGVDVAIAMRAPKKPRDRWREYLTGFRGATDLSDGMEKHRLNVQEQIEFDYTTINAANTLILAETSSTDGFIEPLKFAGAAPLRLTSAEVFAGAGGELAAALIRTIRFRGARRIETRA